MNLQTIFASPLFLHFVVAVVTANSELLIWAENDLSMFRLLEPFPQGGTQASASCLGI